MSLSRNCPTLATNHLRGWSVSGWGHPRRRREVRATSGFPLITAEKTDIPIRLRSPINCGPTELAVIHPGGVRPERQRTKGH